MSISMTNKSKVTRKNKRRNKSKTKIIRNAKMQRRNIINRRRRLILMVKVKKIY